MRAFVTGGTGFIGGHVARRLRGRGDQVLALVRSPAIPVAPVIGKLMGFPPNLAELIRTSDGVTFWMTDQKAQNELGHRARDLDTGLKQTLGVAG